MTATLFDYALREFPGHYISPLGSGDTDLTLRASTLVVHVGGLVETDAVLAIATERVGGDRVGGVVIIRSLSSTNTEGAVSPLAVAGHDSAVVAAFLDNERAAIELARLVADMRQFDIRIVGIDGRWHLPSS